MVRQLCLATDDLSALLFDWLILSSVTLSLTLGSSLSKNLTFQHILIILPVVATISFASCVGPTVSRSLGHDAAATLVRACVTSRRLDHCCSVLVGLLLMLTPRDRVLHSAARLIEVSLNTSLSRVICVTHCIGLVPTQQCICYTVAALVWHCLFGIAPLLQFTCRNSVTLFRTWLVVKQQLYGRQALVLLWWQALSPHVNTSTMQHCAFSIVAPAVQNSLPLSIQFLPKRYTPLFYKLLKTDLYHHGWTRSASC